MIVFENIVNKIILESQESESIKQAKQLVIKSLNLSPEKAEEFVRIRIRESFPILRTKKVENLFLELPGFRLTMN